MRRFILLDSQKSLAGVNKQQIDGIYPIRTKDNNSITICMRQGDALIGYEYIAANKSWSHRFDKVVFNGDKNYPLTQYPWYAADILGTGGNQILLRDRSGMSIYQVDENNQDLELLVTDLLFHNVHGWNEKDHTILLGHFYPDKDLIGVISRNKLGTVKFYAVMQDFVQDQAYDYLGSCQYDISLNASWHNHNTSLSLTNLDHQDQAFIVVRSIKGLEIYRFIDECELDLLVGSTQITNSVVSNQGADQLFFGNFTNQIYQDILHLNVSGLYVYQYDNHAKQDYVAINHNREFSRASGWLPRYNPSIKLLDLDGSGGDKLVFTGINGLTALCFDPVSRGWQSVLDPMTLDHTRRYDQVVGILPAMPLILPEPIIFTQGSNKSELHFGTVITDDTATISTNSSNIIDNSKIILSTLQTDDNRLKISKRIDTIIPQVKDREYIVPKPLAVWRDNWSADLFKDAVDTNSGTLSFTIPLIDSTIAKKLSVSLSLHYNSKSSSEGLIGQQWHLPIGQDYISVDYQNSIYPEDAKYHLILNGARQELQLISNNGELWQFKLADNSAHALKDSATIITYNKAQERFIIENNSFKAIYGKSLDGTILDALQLSLTWPNWRSSGSDAEAQEQYVAAWHLNSYLDKENNQTLYYSYQQDMKQVPNGKNYSAALRLSKIIHNAQDEIIFSYAAKRADEYSGYNPVNQDGSINFPLPLEQSHYLTSCTINTAHFRQRFDFRYQVLDEMRLLEGIGQSLLQAEYTKIIDVIGFEYQELTNNKHLLKTCMLYPSYGVNFSYRTINLPKLPIAHDKVGFDNKDHKITHQIWDPQKTAISYGNDYAVIAYGSNDSELGKIVNLRITNLEMTHNLVDCGVSLPCITEESKINDFALNTYQNSFALHVKIDDAQKIYLFKRNDNDQSDNNIKQSWNATYDAYNFSNNAIISLSKELITVVEKSKQELSILEPNSDNNSWQKTNLTLPRNVISIAAYNKHIVFYNDKDLSIFYRDNNGSWQSKILKANLNFCSATSLDKFDLPNEVRTGLISSFEQNALQIYNNVITLNKLQEHDGVFSVTAYFYLLDKDHNIVREQHFELSKQNILELNYQHISDGTNFTLIYVKEDNKYKVHAKAFSGKLWNDIDKQISNDNGRDDKVAELIKNWNAKGSFNNSFLIDWHPTTLRSEGVYYGNKDKSFFIAMTGNSWQYNEISSKTSVPLSKYFIIESEATDNKLTYKLYNQNRNKEKAGSAIKTMHIKEAWQFINFYPFYIAYQNNAGEVVVLTFKNNNIIDKEYRFEGEQLSRSSNTQNLITTALQDYSNNISIRPISSLIAPAPESLVSSMKITSDGVSRIISYEYSVSSNQRALTYEKQVKIIPGGNKDLAGFYEKKAIYNVNSRNATETNALFDANGQEIKSASSAAKPDTNSNQQEAAKSAKKVATANNNSDLNSSKSHLLDKSGKLLISDFTPYNLNDEMTAYYGFESYETNQIVVPNNDSGNQSGSNGGNNISTNSNHNNGDSNNNINDNGGDGNSDDDNNGNNNKHKAWQIRKGQIKQGFAFTGENYLQLDNTESNSSSSTAKLSDDGAGGNNRANLDDQAAFIAKDFTPLNQKTAYIASCWVRTYDNGANPAIVLNKASSYFKVILSTKDSTKADHEITGMLSYARQQVDDWFYLELVIDFKLMKDIYAAYLDYLVNNDDPLVTNLPLLEEAKFKLTLKAAIESKEKLDIDHIRFTPVNHDFKVSIYDIDGHQTATIQNNGLKSQKLYNNLGQEIASIDADGNIEQLSVTSAKNTFVPAITKLPARITLKPESGFYESFDPYALSSRWSIDNSSGATFKIAPRQLSHQGASNDKIIADAHLFNSDHSALRFDFKMPHSINNSLALNWHDNIKVQLQCYKSYNNVYYAELILADNKKITNLPTQGELIVSLNKNHLLIWLDGFLLADKILSALDKLNLNSWANFSFAMQGNVLLSDLLVMDNPYIEVEYYNMFGQRSQTIQLESSNSAIVTEKIYDQLGRLAITTKASRIMRSDDNAPLLTYQPGFATHTNPNQLNSVWNTGKLQGLVNQLNPDDQGQPYTRTQYEANPFGEKKITGLAGHEFGINGTYATNYSRNPDSAFLYNVFPKSLGYCYQAEYLSNGREEISVFDKHNNQVALYHKVASYNPLLSTYEYDSKNNLIKILPPFYHQHVHTLGATSTWIRQEQNRSDAEKQLQQSFATYFSYDDHGHLIRKITPESHITDYLYNSAGQMRFMVSSFNNQITKIIFFDYDAGDQLKSSGYFTKILSLTELQNLIDNSSLASVPYATTYQTIDYEGKHQDPVMRSNVKRFITNNEFIDQNNITRKIPIAEELRFNNNGKVISKTSLIADKIADKDAVDTDLLLQVKTKYVNDNILHILYPTSLNGQPLKILYHYNSLKQITALELPNQQIHYAKFSYAPSGAVENEHYFPNAISAFTRAYSYNSPGFLEKISDPFLTEELSYTKNGYGQAGYGSGLIMQTSFNASWPLHADYRWFGLQEDDLSDEPNAKLCLNSLKRTGYLSDQYRPIKLFHPQDALILLPNRCRGEDTENIAKLMASKQKPTLYGHSYAYGHHQEIVKAKYFTDETKELIEPLQPESFAMSIPSLSKAQSQEIWQLLIDAGYLRIDERCVTPSASKIAMLNKHKPIINETKLHDDLVNLDQEKYHIVYETVIKQLLIKAIGEKQDISLEQFEKTLLNWTGVFDEQILDLFVAERRSNIRAIYHMLSAKSYLPTPNVEIVLNNDFINILSNYAKCLPDIIQTLTLHSNYALLANSFDLETCHIDANGNHQLFKTGADSIYLAYHPNSNQIDNIITNPVVKTAQLDNAYLSRIAKTFKVEHDSFGNVISAPHKNIQTLTYDPVLQRTSSILLTNGNKIYFYYDAQGERILKKLFDAEQKQVSQTSYLRDEHGKVLVDQHIRYYDDLPPQKLTTSYIYGPQGLLGFIRDDEFYSVTLDHAGSVRLVIKDHRVVAAYDYMPYGELMRSFGHDPKAQVIYRYTGQEWDEETGLYNYHARLYDPSIGRFYQIDPKAQYFSPYKYAGNSPISFIDPDGEEAITIAVIAIIAAGGFAYAGGATANNRWNPKDWDYKDHGTWIGIGTGALAGALLPITFGASFKVAAGFGVTAKIAAHIAAKTALSVTTATNIIAGTGVVMLGGAGMYISAAAVNKDFDPTEWEWSRPKTLNGLLQGFATGSGIMGGVYLVHNFAATKFGVIGSKLFLGASYTAASGVSGASIASLESYTAPEIINALINGFDSGFGWPQGFKEIAKGIGKIARNPKQFIGLIDNISISNKQAIINILKDPHHPLYKITASMVMTYFMGAGANGNLDITKWSPTSFSTYEGILNGIFFGKDTSNMLRLAKKSNLANQDTKNSKLPDDAQTLADDSNSNFKQSFESTLADIDSSYQQYKEQQYQHIMKSLQDDPSILQNILAQQELSPAKRAELQAEIENFLKNELEINKQNSNQQQESNQLNNNDSDNPKRQNQELPGQEHSNGSGNNQTPKEANDNNPSIANNNKVPEALDNIINKLIDQDLPHAFAEMLQWQKQQELAAKQEQEITPDRDTPFLSCGAKRAKRSPDSISSLTSCSTSKSNTPSKRKNTEDGQIDGNTPPLKKVHTESKSELTKLLLESNTQKLYATPDADGYIAIKPLENASTKTQNIDNAENVPVNDNNDTTGGFDPHKPSGFAEHFSLLLKKIPKDHTGNKPEFFNALILGAVSAMKPDGNLKVYVKIENNNIKLCFVDTNAKEVTLRSFDVTGTTTNTEFSQTEIRAVNTQGTIKSLESFRINTSDRLLSVKIQNTDNNAPEGTLQNAGFTEISLGANQNTLVKYLEQINPDNLEQTKEAVKGFSEELLTIYQANKKLGLSKDSEAGLHGFFYGSLALNFKYLHNLDISIERMAGRGYSDMTVLLRGGNDNAKDWQAIPIIFEFKVDGTSAADAIKQIDNTGYLYNIGARTIADKAIIVGIDGNNLQENIDISTKIVVEERTIPQLGNFVDTLTPDNIKTAVDQEITTIKQNIEQQLQHLYYSISNMASKTSGNNHYLSRLILGEIAAQNTEIFTRVYTDAGNPYLDKLITYVFKSKPDSNNNDNNQWIMLNIVESTEAVQSHNSFKDVDIKLPDIGLPTGIEANNVVAINIKVNPKSDKGWSSETPKKQTTSENLKAKDLYYYQDIEIQKKLTGITQSTEYQKLTPKEDTNTIKLENFFDKELARDGNGAIVTMRDESGNNVPVLKVTTELNNLAPYLQKVQHTINSESDFQAVLQGFFLAQSKKTGVAIEVNGVTKECTQLFKIMPEMNTSHAGRNDLTISRILVDASGAVVKEQLILMELKYANNAAAVDGKTREANKQINDHIEAHNLKSLTDGKQIITIPIVFNKQQAIQNADKIQKQETLDQDDITKVLKATPEIQYISHTSATNTPAGSQAQSIQGTPQGQKTVDMNSESNKGPDSEVEMQSQNDQPAAHIISRRSADLIFRSDIDDLEIDSENLNNDLKLDPNVAVVSIVNQPANIDQNHKLSEPEETKRLSFSSSNIPAATSSGTSNMHFWPITILKNAKEFITSSVVDSNLMNNQYVVAEDVGDNSHDSLNNLTSDLTRFDNTDHSNNQQAPDASVENAIAVERATINEHITATGLLDNVDMVDSAIKRPDYLQASRATSNIKQEVPSWLQIPMLTNHADNDACLHNTNSQYQDSTFRIGDNNSYDNPNSANNPVDPVNINATMQLLNWASSVFPRLTKFIGLRSAKHIKTTQMYNSAEEQEIHNKSIIDSIYTQSLEWQNNKSHIDKEKLKLKCFNIETNFIQKVNNIFDRFIKGKELELENIRHDKDQYKIAIDQTNILIDQLHGVASEHHTQIIAKINLMINREDFYGIKQMGKAAEKFITKLQCSLASSLELAHIDTAADNATDQQNIIHKDAELNVEHDGVQIQQGQATLYNQKMQKAADSQLSNENCNSGINYHEPIWHNISMTQGINEDASCLGQNISDILLINEQ